MATIDEVAELAGVSRSTVSRVFVDPARTSEAAQRSVRDAAEKLGYLPNRVSRSDAPVARSVLGVMVPDLWAPFFSQAAAAFAQVARRRNYLVHIADPDPTGADEQQVVEALSRQVDGLLLWAPDSDSDLLRRIDQRVPVVVVNRIVEGLSGVLSSGVEGVRDAFEHLAALGHRRVCYVRAETLSWTTEVRREAAVQAAAEFDLQLVELGPYPSSFDGGLLAADVAVRRSVTALVAQNDTVALGAIRQFTKRGLDVPRDISVIGVNDSSVASTCTPALTTVRIPVLEVAGVAMQAITNRLRSTSAGSVTTTVAGRLIVRDTTAAPRF